MSIVIGIYIRMAIDDSQVRDMFKGASAVCVIGGASAVESHQGCECCRVSSVVRVQWTYHANTSQT